MVKALLKYDCPERRIVIGLVLAIVFSSGLYMYFVYQTAHNTASRRALQIEISSLNSEVGDLAFRYMEVKNLITLDFAHSLGYSDADSVSFISRDRLTRSLTFNALETN